MHRRRGQKQQCPKLRTQLPILKEVTTLILKFRMQSLALLLMVQVTVFHDF